MDRLIERGIILVCWVAAGAGLVALGLVELAMCLAFTVGAVVGLA